jgi:hypothetical protein
MDLVRKEPLLLLLLLLLALGAAAAAPTGGGMLPCIGTSLQNLSLPSLWRMVVLPELMGSGDVGSVAL